jgi:hypothetical protein
MDVWFNFPDLIAFKIQMNLPPRQGEFVYTSNIPHDCFRNSNEWNLHFDKKHNQGEWVITRVTYTIHPESTYANVLLQRPAIAGPTQN